MFEMTTKYLRRIQSYFLIDLLYRSRYDFILYFLHKNWHFIDVHVE